MKKKHIFLNCLRVFLMTVILFSATGVQADPPAPSTSGPANPTARHTAPPKMMGGSLWSQAAAEGSARATQDFESSMDNYDLYIADDFENQEIWDLSTIYIPGQLSNGGTTLLNAISLNWMIYRDDNGKPAGSPVDGELAVWSLSLPPSDPQVTLSQGVDGQYSDATLHLDSPVLLPPGRWWLVFFPRMDFTPNGQYYWQPASTTNLSDAQVYNPGHGFFQTTTWTSVRDATTFNITQQDFAFMLGGTYHDGILYETAPVTVDGSCTKPEWINSELYHFVDNGGSGAVRLKHDANNLYVCVIGPAGTYADRFFSVYLDTNFGREAHAQNEDLSLRVTVETSTMSNGRGTGSGNFTQVRKMDGWSAAAKTTTGASDSAEFQIPLALTGARSCGGMLGIAVYHHWLNNVGDDYGWQTAKFYDTPLSWPATFLASPVCVNLPYVAR